MAFKNQEVPSGQEQPKDVERSADRKALAADLENLYDAYRTVRMNQKYYGFHLQHCLKWNMRLDILLAVSASGAIGTWAVWRTPGGEPVWAALTGLAAVVAVIKPILRFPDRIQRYSELWVGVGDVFFDLSRLVEIARSKKAFTPDMARTFSAAFDRLKRLSRLDDPQPNQEMLKRCYDEVLTEIPAASLWMPTAPANIK